MTVPDDYRKESRARWGEQARGWGAQAERLATTTMPVSVWLVDALDLQPGHEVLELAAGTGEVGFLAAEQIEPGGTLISSDFVPEMITVAQARAERLGITNVRFRQIDAESIDQPAASLDGVLCRWGYMLMADGEAALRETRRILRPGARVALAAWTGPGENPWASLPSRELVARGHMDRPDPDAPGQFAWARNGIIEERLDGAGFGEHEVDVVDFVYAFASFDDWIDTQRSLASRFRDALDGLAAAERDDVLATVREQALPYVQEDGSLALPARTWVAWGSA
jgi:SAM-dependent methyltransferase